MDSMLHSTIFVLERDRKRVKERRGSRMFEETSRERGGEKGKRMGETGKGKRGETGKEGEERRRGEDWKIYTIDASSIEFIASFSTLNILLINFAYKFAYNLMSNSIVSLLLSQI